ncbi:hypothetical protein [Sandarakinorhabdus sp.]|uniref:hypothetical protein n=1 Tax=Sandarakinorhabdus sp. TaxID=1916663 RepID=UPI003F72A5DC
MSEPSQPSGLLRWEPQVKALATVLAFIFGLPSLIYTWRSLSNDRQIAFDRAVQQKEEIVKKNYDILFSGLADLQSDKENLSGLAKLEAVCMFINSQSLEISGYDLGVFPPDHETQQHQDAKQRLYDLQFGIKKILNNNTPVIEQISPCNRYILTAEANLNEVQERVDVESTPKPGATSDENAAPPIKEAEAELLRKEAENNADLLKTKLDPGTLKAVAIVGFGRNDGWAVDVFWCDGQNANVNLSLATQIAKQLNKPTFVYDNLEYPVGRVRLRILSIARQRDPGYRPLGYEVRGEATEQPVAVALTKFLSSEGAKQTFRYRRSQQVTPWYLSVFVCQP